MGRAVMEVLSMQTVNGTFIGSLTEGAVVTNLMEIQTSTGGIFATSKPLDFENGNGAGNRNKKVSHVRVDIETDASDTIPSAFTVRLGTQLRLKDPIRWATTKTLTSLNQLFPFNLEGRYFTLEIRDTSPTVLWRLTKVEFLGVLTGKAL